MGNIAPTPQTSQPGSTVPLRDHLIAAEASEQDYQRLMAEHRARRQVLEEAAQQTAPYELATVRTRNRRRRLY